MLALIIKIAIFALCLDYLFYRLFKNWGEFDKPVKKTNLEIFWSIK